MGDTFNYYESQLSKVQPAVSNEYGISVKFTSSLHDCETKYMALNDESASAIVEFLSNNYTLTLK